MVTFRRCLEYLAGFGLTAAWLLAVSAGLVHAQDQAPKTGADEAVESVPSLADVVYRAGALGQQLEELKSRIETVNNLQQLEKRLERAKMRTDGFNTRLAALNVDDLQSYQQLAALKGEVRGEADAVDRVVAALSESIRAVEGWRRQWSAEKNRWAQWRAVLGEDLALQSVADASTRAGAAIDAALDLIALKLEPLLVVQQKAGDIAARTRGLLDRIDAMMAQQRGGSLRGGTPLMFSVGYLRQLIDLALDPAKLIKPLPPPGPVFFSRKGWVIILQAVVFAALLILLRRYRPILLEHTGRRFLGKRSVSVSLFTAVFTLSFLYGPQPAVWRMLIQTLAGGAAARLGAAFVREAWIKRAIYILIFVMIAFQILLILGVPLALMRLFILIWTAAGMVYYGWRARQRVDSGNTHWSGWLLRLIVLVFGIIAATDIIGLGGFAVQLMDGAIRTAVLLLMGWAMIRLARVALEAGFESLPMENLAFLRKNAHVILARATLACNILIVAFVASSLLAAWKLYVVPMEALQAFFTFGITLGGQKITVGLVLVAAVILYGAFVLSWGLQSLLLENVLSRRQMDAGARISIARLVHYALVLVGFLIALSALGFELKNVTIIGGALGVGIGFGMQTIVNNFVCGLILLFERPIKVGDVIQLTDGQQGRVLNLGLRATTIQTFDRAEIVVPNSDLIAGQVVNWTLGDRSIRLTIPVGVAYGSDVETVMRVLMEVAAQNPRVLKDPKPMVLFLSFGDSSLNFQLRAWILDFNDRRIIQSELVCEIDRRFRAENLEIPFPQRDIHLRSVDLEAAGHLKAQNPAPDEPGPGSP
jgi:potassium-dependent mechanosensitive channel